MTDWTSPHILRQNAVATNMLNHVLIGLFMWEWVVSLDFDVALLSGKRRFRWPMILYLLDRYVTLSGLIYAMVLFDSPAKQDCNTGFHIVAFFGSTSLSLSSLMLSLRTMAVWNRDRRVVIPVAILVLAHFALSCFSGLILGATSDGNLGCVSNGSVSPGPAILYGYTVAFDLIILVLTGWKLWSPTLYQADMKRRTKGVAVLLFQDGLVYFVVACAVNTIALVLSVLNLNPLMSVIGDPLANIVTTVAACRVVRRLELHSEQANDYFSGLIPTISISEPSGTQRSAAATGPVEVELTTFRHTPDQPSEEEYGHSDGVHPSVTEGPSAKHERL